MSTLNLARIPFVLEIQTPKNYITLGKVQHSEWVLEVDVTYTTNTTPVKMYFNLRRTSSFKKVFAQVIIFIPNNHFFQDFHLEFDFKKCQHEIGIPIYTNPFERFPTVYGVVNLYDIPDVCIQSWNGILTTISFPPSPAQHLTKDLTNLFESDPQVLSDAILKCQGVNIPVHKCILAARSPVFAAMFTSDMEEARSNSVDIEDMDPDILRKVLKYIYTGQADDFPFIMAGDVLYAAEKYGLIELKNICVDKMKSNLTVDNVFEILVVGELHDDSLKELATAFICNHSDFSKLEEMEQWKLLVKNRPALAIEVLTASLKFKQDLLIQNQGISQY